MGYFGSGDHGGDGYDGDQTEKTGRRRRQERGVKSGFCLHLEKLFHNKLSLRCYLKHTL